jgi:hypothetical protein
MTRLTFILTLLTFSALGQCTNCEEKNGHKMCWGENRSDTEIHLATFMGLTHMVDSDQGGRVEEALNELNWLLDKAPCVNICLYISGEKFIQKVLTFGISVKIKEAYSKTLKELKELKAKNYGADTVPTFPCFYN